VSANPERDELLRAIVAADHALRPDRQRFRVHRIESHAGQQLIHNGFSRLSDRDWRECNRQDIEDLDAQGLIRLEKTKRKAQAVGPRAYWEEWFFDVTDAGFEKVEREQRAANESVGGGDTSSGSYDWKTEALPVLEAVYTASASADVDVGVSHKTINEVLGRQPNDPQTDRIVTMLVQGDYLERTAFEGMGSRFCQITEKGLQITAGWPSGARDAAYERLLALIDEHVEEAASDEERSKWQRLRDAVVGVGRDVAVEVLSAAAQTGLRHIP
jgi:hypothetical protein